MFQSYSTFVSDVLPAASVILPIVACLPLPTYTLIGMSGEVIFAPLSALCLWLAVGFVGLAIMVLESLLWVVRRLGYIRYVASSPM